jgi:hypothetical protein
MPTTTDHDEDDPLHRRITKLLADAELSYSKMEAARARMEAYEAESFSHLQEVLSRVDAFHAGHDKVTAALETAGEGGANAT